MQCKSCWQHLLVAAICCALHQSLITAACLGSLLDVCIVAAIPIKDSQVRDEQPTALTLFPIFSLAQTLSVQASVDSIHDDGINTQSCGYTEVLGQFFHRCGGKASYFSTAAVEKLQLAWDLGFCKCQHSQFTYSLLIK